MKLVGEKNIHENELISRFMKGVFNSKPSLPRYTEIWDVNIVLQYLEKMQTETLSALSCKFCMLFLLITAQRCQTLHVIKISDIKRIDGGFSINISSLLKQSRCDFHLQPIILESYPNNEKLCIVTLMNEYLDRTRNLRNGEHLLISTIKPHGRVSQQTVSRWIKLTMHNAGIPNTFKPHSTRAASTSKAFGKGVPLPIIIKTAGWNNARTFAKYYNKPLFSSTDIFQGKLLEST